MDRATGRFTTLTEKDGLCDNALTSLLEDEEGNLWLSAKNCLAKFNPRAHLPQLHGARRAGVRRLSRPATAPPSVLPLPTL